jgi:hypothetical protein
MNIFYLSHKPSRCARWHCDKHVVKMILETTQLLYTAHWFLAAAANGAGKVAVALPDFSTAPTLATNPSQRGYLSIRNPRHPCAIWTRESLTNYKWLCELGMALCQEFQHRFGGSHSCEEHLYWLYAHPPPTIPRAGWTMPAQAMPDEYRCKGNSILAYRAYYKLNKGEQRGMLTYTARHSPHWLSASGR